MAPAARFIHMDYTRDGARGVAAMFAEAEGLGYERAVIYNVWKPMTPPPQDPAAGHRQLAHGVFQ